MFELCYFLNNRNVRHHRLPFWLAIPSSILPFSNIVSTISAKSLTLCPVSCSAEVKSTSGGLLEGCPSSPMSRSNSLVPFLLFDSSCVASVALDKGRCPQEWIGVTGKPEQSYLICTGVVVSAFTNVFILGTLTLFSLGVFSLVEENLRTTDEKHPALWVLCFLAFGKFNLISFLYSSTSLTAKLFPVIVSHITLTISELSCNAHILLPFPYFVTASFCGLCFTNSSHGDTSQVPTVFLLMKYSTASCIKATSHFLVELGCE